MAVYKHFCIYCDKLIPGDANVCPYCGAEDPFCLRCPKCRGPVEEGYKACPSCGLELTIKCPSCGKDAPAYLKACPHCASSLLGTCSNKRCGNRQLFTIGVCMKCKSKVVF